MTYRLRLPVVGVDTTPMGAPNKAVNASLLMPPDELEGQPIVAVCRAGGRSAQATVILRRAGFSDVANLADGMLRWRAERCPVEGATE